jgi:molybdopterin-containing oxidoreductase family membrane subunit
MMDFVRANRFWLWIAFLLVLIGIAFVAVFQIMTRGLGVTGLSDGTPWGLWIIVDLSCIGLAAGAFSISAITHLLGREQYKPLARVAVFIGLLGYSGALMALIMDIGRPDRFWHGWVFWNPHSMLWEVTMCITLYFSVLTLEVFPMIVELPLFARFKWLTSLGHRIHRYAPALAVLGLCLSLLHQSSLGATYGVVIGRTAVFRTTMPLLFIVSAVAAGMAFTVHMTLIVQWLTGRTLVPSPVLFEVGQIAGVILLLYLYMRFWDASAGNYGYVPGRTESQNVLTGGVFAVSFWAWQMILGGLVAAFLLIRARMLQSFLALIVGSGLAMAGLVANRYHTTLLAFTQPLATNPPVTSPLVSPYTPAWTEWATALGVVAILTLLFSLGIRFLPAFKGLPETVPMPDEPLEQASDEQPEPAPSGSTA